MSLLADPPVAETVLEPDTTQPTEPADVRVFVLAGLRPAAISLAATAALLLLTIAGGGAGFGDSAFYIASAWLALHQVPVQIASDFLGLLPLAATAALVALSARAARKLAGHIQNYRDVGLVLGGLAAGPILIAVLAIAVVSNASIESKLEAPPTLSVLGWVVAVHLCGAIVGLRNSMPPLPHRVVPGWVVNAGEAARSAVRLLFLAGLAAAVGVAVVRWTAVEASLTAGNGAGGAIGLTVVSLLYLPNMAIFAVGVLSGSAVTLGDGSVSLFEVAQGQVPPLPIMAALPDGPAQTWWQAFLLIPLFIAVFTGRKCARSAGARRPAVRMAVVSALICAVVAYAAAIVSGGVLGAIGFVGLSPLLFAVSVFVWFALFGSLAAAFRVRVKPAKVVPEPKKPEEPEPASAPEPEAEAEAVPEDEPTENATEKAPEVKVEDDKKPGLVSSVVNLLPIPFLKK